MKKTGIDQDEEKKKKKPEKAKPTKPKEDKTEEPSVVGEGDEEDDGFQVIGKRNKRKKEKVVVVVLQWLAHREITLPISSQVLFAKGEEITFDSVHAKAEEVLEARGKMSTSHADQRKLFKELRDVSLEGSGGEEGCGRILWLVFPQSQAALSSGLGFGLVVSLQMQVIASHFDEPSSVAGYMRPAAWAK